MGFKNDYRNTQQIKAQQEIKEMEEKLTARILPDGSEISEQEYRKFRKKNFVFNSNNNPVPHDTPMKDLFYLIDSGQVRELGSIPEDSYIPDKKVKEYQPNVVTTPDFGNSYVAPENPQVNLPKWME